MSVDCCDFSDFESGLHRLLKLWRRMYVVVYNKKRTESKTATKMPGALPEVVVVGSRILAYTICDHQGRSRGGRVSTGSHTAWQAKTY